MKRKSQGEQIDTCDEWLSTRNKRKISPSTSHPRKRRSLSRPFKSSSNNLRLTQNSPPPPQLMTTTKQTSIKTFFQHSICSVTDDIEGEKEEIFSDSEDYQDNSSSNSNTILDVLKGDHLNKDWSKGDNSNSDNEISLRRSYANNNTYEGQSCHSSHYFQDELNGGIITEGKLHDLINGDSDNSCDNVVLTDLNSVYQNDYNVSKTHYNIQTEKNKTYSLKNMATQDKSESCIDKMKDMESRKITLHSPKIYFDSEFSKFKTPLRNVTNFIDSVQADLELESMLPDADFDSQEDISPNKNCAGSLTINSFDVHGHSYPGQSQSLIDSQEADFELQDFSLKS